jgi:cytochrome b561
MRLRYSNANQALHWITVACIFAILPLGWVMVNASEHLAFRASLFNWHKTLGAIVLIVTAVRIVWRFYDPPPPYPPQVAAWDRLIAHLVYWLFFAVMIFMPITGLLTTVYGSHPTKLFDLVPLPQLVGQDKGLSDFYGDLHLAGQWAVYALIVLHLAGVVMHVIWGRDGVLGRMLPETSVAEPGEAVAAVRPRSAPEPQAPYARAR